MKGEPFGSFAEHGPKRENPKVKRVGVRQVSNWTQFFSDFGKTGNPVWGRPFLVGQPPKKGTKGATEQLSGSQDSWPTSGAYGLLA